MISLTNKLSNIFERLNFLLSRLKSICVTKLYLLPNQINKVVVGENKLPMHLSDSLQEITESDLTGSTSIDEYEFSYYSNLVSVEIPDSVTSIGDYAFWDCTSLTSITIPDSVTSINSWAFSSCSSLKSITIPNSVTSIDDYAFFYCTNLKSVTIGNSVITIGYRTFDSCMALENIILPNSVTTIEYMAFGGCYNLKSVTIGNGITTIGADVFSACFNLTDIYLNSVTPPTLGNTSAIPDTTTIHVPIGSGDAYKSATNWSYHSDRIVEDIVIE